MPTACSKFAQTRPRSRFVLFVIGGLLLAAPAARADSAEALPAPVRPRIVPAILIKKDKLTGDSPHLPEVVKAQRTGQVVTGSYKLCLGLTGDVTTVDTINGIAGADDGIMKTLRGWRYKPQSIPVCFIQFLEFRISGPPPDKAPAGVPVKTPASG